MSASEDGQPSKMECSQLHPWKDTSKQEALKRADCTLKKDQFSAKLEQSLARCEYEMSPVVWACNPGWGPAVFVCRPCTQKSPLSVL